MARVKLSEFRAKETLNRFLGLSYSGFPFDAEEDDKSKIKKSIEEGKRYVVKVDQGVKKRFKQGLVALDVSGVSKVVDSILEFGEKGYRYFLIEEFLPHDKEDEKYIALARSAKGIIIYYSKKGGVDIEESGSEVSQLLYKDAEDAKKVAEELGVETAFVEKLIEAFDIYYFSFLEINPLVVSFKKPYMLDIAGEVDSAAEFFVDEWSSRDFRSARSDLTEEEKNIRELAQKSSSSLTLTVLNPDGAIFMLLSGGGVSVALADEVANLGKGGTLANYGEYSGNPTEEETYIYTKNLLSLLLKSKAPRKVLIVGGGVANFTDVRITFKGIIRALSDALSKLQQEGVKVFVRRGGPHQKEGLSMMEKFLSENDLTGVVAGPEMILSEIVKKAIGEIE